MEAEESDIYHAEVIGLANCSVPKTAMERWGGVCVGGGAYLHTLAPWLGGAVAGQIGGLSCTPRQAPLAPL